MSSQFENPRSFRRDDGAAPHTRPSAPPSTSGSDRPPRPRAYDSIEVPHSQTAIPQADGAA